MNFNFFSCENLSAGYGKKEVLKNITLSFEKGQTASIIGPNGSGKSTLLKCMGRLMKPSAGCVYLDGKSISALTDSSIAKSVGILPQSPNAPADIPVHCLVAYGRNPHKKVLSSFTKEDKQTVDWAIEATGLKDKRFARLGQLSGGERQRAWIAMALAQSPKILLLDEPTTYLDIHHQFEVLELLEKLNTECGLTVVMVMHDLNLASRFSGRLIAMKDGEVRLDGAGRDILTEQNIYDIFKVKSRIVSLDGSTAAMYMGVA